MNSFIRLVIGKLNLAIGFASAQSAIAIIGLTIGFLVFNPTSAQAETSVALDTANDLVKVATVYKTEPETQNKVLSEFPLSPHQTFDIRGICQTSWIIT